MHFGLSSAQGRLIDRAKRLPPANFEAAYHSAGGS